MVNKIAPVYNIVLFLLCILKVRSWVVDDAGCRTPDGGVGECVFAKECPSMINFLKAAPKPLPFDLKNKLRAYTCSYEKNQVKICCPESPITIPLPPKKNSSGLGGKTDITNHKNFYLLPKECGYTGIPNKISNGKNASLGEYPWMALLSYSTPNGPKFKCGGTVINNKYILTAAHCITRLKEPLLGVRIGEYDLSTEVDCEVQEDDSIKCASMPIQDFAIEKIIPHSNFNTDYNNVDGFNDIGLIRVAKEINMGENIQPICLPTGEAMNAKLTRVFITGWGYTEKQSKVNNILQTASIPVIRQSECQKSYKQIRISHKQLCAYGKEKDSCSGDSGGPLQTQKFLYDDIRSIQYGVISFGGAVCGSASFPGIYTRTDSYMDWILDNMEP